MNLTHLPTSLLWLIFAGIVALILFLDLFVFHKKAETPSIKSTLTICAAYMMVALAFGLFVIFEKGWDTGLLYYTGYLVEFSLSLDNIFVISLIFTSMKIPTIYQHRVLFWGVFGAIVMRAVMILLGAGLVEKFHWILYLFSAFLIYTGVQMLVQRHETAEANADENKILKFLKRFMPVTRRLHGEHFFVKRFRKTAITPLFLTLLTIELMDVIFAVDSIPAIFLITQDIFVIYTSNIFAILGLRSLYFLLAAAVNRFVYLKHALALVLIFIGLKIFAPFTGITITNAVSLAVTFLLLAGGIGFSLLKTRRRTI